MCNFQIIKGENEKILIIPSQERERKERGRKGKREEGQVKREIVITESIKGGSGNKYKES